MDQYCVVLCGLRAGTLDEAAAWQPVAAALKLDHAEFERRVVAALPRIVRQDLDQATAERIAQVLHALQVDARVLPDDPQLVYIERSGASCGPLPQSSLADFIQPGESFRLRGDTTWQAWPTPVDQDLAETGTTTVERDDIDDPPSSPVRGDEPIDVMSTAGTSNNVGDAAPDEPSTGADHESPDVTSNPPSFDTSADVSGVTRDALPTGADDETPDAMSPSLSVPSTAQPEPSPAPPEKLAATEPAPDVTESARGDDPINASGETTTSDSFGAFPAATPQAAETGTPTRLRIGRLVVLLILVALAVWAYRHWRADTRMEGSPAAPAVIPQSSPVAGEPATPAQAASTHNSASATPALVTTATSVPAPATTAASPATTTSAPAPAATAAAPANETSAATPAGTATSPATAAGIAPATVTKAAATVPAESSGTLPASVGTVALAEPVRTGPVAAAHPAPSAH